MSDVETKKQSTTTGIVRSIAGQKSITVVVNNLVKHDMYNKFVRRRTTLQVRDEQSEAKIGDEVEITPCRPVSKRIAHRLVRVVTVAVEL